jgi:filamentous hemagglutinin family protein
MKVETLSHTRRAAAAPLRRKLIAVLVAACYTTAEASPVSPTVVAGQASFNLQGKTYSITNTPNTIINWQSFSVASDEITRFIQQSADSKVLNRITGQDPTQILGSLQSNGKVFLINPNGVMFGAGSRVDVNGLVASSLAISNADFLAGKNNFTDVANAGKVSNAGTITTPAGGQIFLVAPAVENSGIISSANGDVVLAAGHSVQLFDSKDPNVQVVVSSPSDQAVNLGQIVAQGGRVGVYGALVSQRGAINANSAVRGENGRIVLKSSGTTMVEAGSTTTAVGSNLNTGGDIQLLGDKVGLTGNAVVDASGAAGGGTVLVGGDYQGKNAAVQNAQQTFVGKDAVIKADATGLGDGGKVIVWSDEATRVYGSISARGGANGGNGGFVETSGHYLDMQGAVDTRAPHGTTGKLLLDPSDIYIADSAQNADSAGMEGSNEVPSSASTFLETGFWVDSLLTTATLQSALASSDVTVSTVNTINRCDAGHCGQGFIKLVNPLTWTSSHGLTLTAATDINLNAAINAPNAGLILQANGGMITQSTSSADKLSVAGINAVAASSIALDNASNTVSGAIALQTTSGDATVTAQNLTLGKVTVGGALNVHASTGQIVQTTSPIDGLTASSINAIAIGNIAFDNTGNSVSGQIALQTTSGDATVTAHSVNLGAVTVGGGLTATASSGNLTVAGNITSGGDVALTAATAGASITTNASTAIAATDGDISLVADNMTLGGTMQGGGYSHSVLLQPYSPATNIALGVGAADSGATLGLSQAELQGINVGTNGLLEIGSGLNSYTGAIAVSGNLNLSSSLAGGLLLQTHSGNIAVGGGVALSVPGVVSFETNPSGTAGFTNSGNVNAGSDINIFTGKATLAGGTLSSPSVSLSSVNAIDLGASSGASGVMTLSNADLATINTGSTGSLSVSVNSGNPTGDITISQPLTVAGSLALQAQRNVVAQADVAVGGTFILYGGAWSQIGTLPEFSAHDFRLAGGSFIRALSGDGSSATPYLLADVYGLQGAGTLAASTSFKLNNNIDASGTASWNGNQGFAPIGGIDYAYNGIFDGNNMAISGLNIVRAASDNVGLFSYLGSGTVKDITLSAGVIRGRNNVGGLFGASGSTSGLVQNVHSDAEVTGISNVGGLAGRNYAAITDSSSSGKVTGNAGTDGSNIGGLVGQNIGSVSHSSSSSVVGSTGYGYTGGLVGSNATDGYNVGSISHAFATGKVTSTGEIIGGLVGDNNGGAISVAYSTGDVNGGRNVGGFAGRNTSNGSIANVYTSSNVSGNALDSSYSHSNMGGLLGDLNSGTVSNSFSNGSVTGTAFSGANVYGMVGSYESGNLVHGYFDSTKAGTGSDIAGTALTTAQTMKAASFAGFDISGQSRDQSSSVWRIYEGHTVPMLRDYLTPTTVAVTGGSDVTKVYDGTGAAFGGALVSSLPVGVDGGLAFDGPFNVGDHGVGGLYSSKYDISYTGSSALLHVTPAPLSLSLLSREYNGTTAGTVTDATLVGVVHIGDSYDNVSLVAGNATATYADKNVGVGKTVTLGGTGLALSGADAGNYTVPASATGTITARPLSTFNAVGGGLWSVAGNWVDGIAPDGANVLAAAIQSGSGTITYDASAGNTTLANFSVGSGRNLELTGGALTITGTGGKSYASGATLTLNGGSLVLNGSLDGTYLTLTSGTISGTSSSANLYVNNLTQTGGSIDMSGSLNVINGNSIAIGSVRAQSGITLNAGEGGTITQTGPLVTDSLHAMATNGITLTNTGNHVGTFTATNYSGDIRLNNTVSSGELALGPLSTTGNIIIDNHGGIHTTGTIHAIHSGANTGLVSIAAHSPITVNDAIDGSDIGLSASTSITLAPGTSLQSTNTIGLSAGTGIAMDSSSVVNSGSSIALTAGTGIVLGGSLSVASGGSISATAASGSITAGSGTSINSSGGTIILAAPQGSVTTPNVTFTGVQPTVTDGAAAAAAAAQAAAAAAAAQAAADAAAKAAADAAAKAAADAAAAAAAQAAADAAAKAAADAAAKAAADAAAKAAADAAAAQAAADAAKAAADAAAKAAADAAAKAAADAAAKAAADAAAKAAADAAAKAAADAAAQAAADAAAKAASDAAAKAAADAAAKAAADAAAAAAAAAGSSTPTPVAQALNSTVNIINTVTTTVQANKNTPATVPAAPDTTVANTGTGSASGGNSKPDDKVPDTKTTDKKDDSGTTALAKNEPAKKMYCN